MDFFKGLAHLGTPDIKPHASLRVDVCEQYLARCIVVVAVDLADAILACAIRTQGRYRPS
ncbi:MAG: hypothetical protein MZU95_13370 [Desulfomicrobium escambiense]|nr:hypothetical protein [Desulfomicrobium escambiense]